MEYDFTIDEQGRALAVLSSGHSAIGCWLTDELGVNSEQLTRLLEIIVELDAKTLYEHEEIGLRFSLKLSREHAIVSANNLAMTHADLQEDREEEFTGTTDFYDEELFAECGLTDFAAVLKSWHSFITS